MILDQIQNIESYAGLLPRIMQGLQFLANFEPEMFVPGKKEIDGAALFVLFQEYTSKALSEGKWESHQRYADIQFIFKGQERIGYAPRSSLSETTAYNARDDYALHEGEGMYLEMKEGWFAVFFPQDAHMPGIAVGQSSQVQKIVLKIEL
jgi:YhcH/YjgK/YiaL family protein